MSQDYQERWFQQHYITQTWARKAYEKVKDYCGRHSKGHEVTDTEGRTHALEMLYECFWYSVKKIVYLKNNEKTTSETTFKTSLRQHPNSNQMKTQLWLQMTAPQTICLCKVRAHTPPHSWARAATALMCMAPKLLHFERTSSCPQENGNS